MSTTPNTEDLHAAEADDPTYWDIVWGQFKKNRIGYASMWAVVGLIALAIYAPLLAESRPLYLSGPDGWSSPWFWGLWDRNHFEGLVDIFFNLIMILGTPMFLVLMGLKRRWAGLARRRRRERLAIAARVMIGLLLLVLARMVVRPEEGAGLLSLFGLKVAFVHAIPLAVLGSVLRGLWRDPMATGKGPVTGLVVVLALLVFASPIRYFSQPYADYTSLRDGTDTEQTAVFPLVPYSFRENFLLQSRDDGGGASANPSDSHILGTDNKGRDTLVRLLYGTRISLTVGVVAVSIYVTIGIILGSLAGFFGGLVDMTVLRLIEVWLSVPSFFVILTVISFIEERSIFHLMVIIGLFRWTGVARLVRGEFLRLRGLDFVQAAIALGVPQGRIIFRYVLPNALGPVLVAGTFGIASAILVEASLSFLGLGDPSAPSWGELLIMGRNTGKLVMILAPGMAIFITVSLLNLMGEGLRDALDPKLRK